MSVSYAIKQARAKEYLARRRADLKDQLERLVTLIEYVQDAVTTEITTGEGAKKRHVQLEDVRKLGQVTSMMEVATRTLISLAKADKLLASQLSSEEILDSARKRLMAEKPEDRGKLLYAMVQDHLKESPGNGPGDPLNGSEKALNRVLRLLRTQLPPELIKTDEALDDKTGAPG